MTKGGAWFPIEITETMLQIWSALMINPEHFYYIANSIRAAAVVQLS